MSRAWVLGVVAAAVALALYGRAVERAARQVGVRDLTEAAASAREAPVAPVVPTDEARTLPVGEAASEADGVLELRVTEGERPASRAQVRLYRRRGRSPETGRVEWRVAAAGATGNDGRLLMPARPGNYLVVARTEGSAPTWLNLIHPLNGNRTPVHLRLGGATSFSGRTVAQGTGKALPKAELTLTPYVNSWEQEARADAPAEERVTVTSDARGHFRVERLAPGLYTVEGRAPGGPFTVEWNIRVPTDEPRVLALPDGAVRARMPQRAPSKELRCGM
ncbi:MAG: hypothetical protein JXB05_07075 [Myxococcaceae bacterium]|nr:hypothetical protein [Myxococcaceae bacterium]